MKKELDKVYNLTKEFVEYHERALPLCAAENVISEFANIPLSVGFQERYIMNNTYSFSADDNFIGCEKLYPFYVELSNVCERLFSAKYTDARPFTGMNCIDMVVKSLCKPGDKIMILGKEYGGHASVKPVIEKLGIEVLDAPYHLSNYDLDYEQLNKEVKEKNVNFILLAPSDIIKPLDVERIDTTNATLLYDCSQLLGFIAAGLLPNPLKTMKNIVLFGGTHKTFPGPASGLILTNEEELHNKMEKTINPTLLRHSQMHQKISLLFAMLEFEDFGKDYMKKVDHCSNYLAKKLEEKGFDIAKIGDRYSYTHQIFMKCSKEIMDTIYSNAYDCEVTLNKKHKKLFDDYGIRLGTQEIARYDYDDNSMDLIATIINEISKKECDVTSVKKLVKSLPKKEIHYAYGQDIIDKFKNI